MTDTHTHIYMPEFDDGGAGAVVAALEAGVEMVVFPGVDSDSVDRMKELHSRFPGNTALSIGLHPTELEENWEEELESIDRAFDGCEVKAIGETGMDLYWDSSFEERQRAAFARHIDMAHERSLPVIIHCREALVPVLEVIAERKRLTLRRDRSFLSLYSTVSPETERMWWQSEKCATLISESTEWSHSRMPPVFERRCLKSASIDCFLKQIHLISHRYRSVENGTRARESP